MSAIERLANTIAARAGADPDTSWTARLLGQGPVRSLLLLHQSAL